MLSRHKLYLLHVCSAQINGTDTLLHLMQTLINLFLHHVYFDVASSPFPATGK